MREPGFDGSTPLLAPVPALATFRITTYCNEADPPRQLSAVFALRQPEHDGFRSFDSVRKQLIVAAMVRHAASRPAVAESLGWSATEAAQFVLGHAEARGQAHVPVDGPRLAIMPLPSIEFRGEMRALSVSSVRRVLITVFGPAKREEFRRLVQMLAGLELHAEGSPEPVTVLQRINGPDAVASRYTGSASDWATVTPVILPGYDDPRKLRQRLRANVSPAPSSAEKKALLGKLDQRIEFLLRKTIRQAGLTEEMARYAEIDWRDAGFWSGTDLASRYVVPEQHRRFRRLHVRIRWRDAQGQPINVPGPLCLGGGRFVGLGLFAALTV